MKISRAERMMESVKRGIGRMNQFINLSQRGPQLPEGCKDLIDVLRQPWLMQSGTPAKGQRVQQSNYQSGTVGQIEFHVCRLFMSGPEWRTLCIGCVEPKVGLLLMHRDEAVNVSLVVDSEQAQLSRTVFQDAAISPISDSFAEVAGVSTGVLKFPLPDFAPAAARLSCDLLRRGFGVSDEHEIYFYYHQTTAA